jgi:hypothetical protein
MKIRNEVYFLITCIMFLIYTGCNEKNYSVKTKVNPDGSFERIFIVEKDDSAGVYNNPFPVVFDSTWTINIKRVNDTSKIFIYSAKKYFSSSEELEKDNVFTESPDKINITTKITKQFLWFYTYYNFKEIYRGNNPFNSIPLKKYFSENEIKQIYSDSTDKVLKERVEEWLQRNIFEEYFEILSNGLSKINDPVLTEDLLNSKKEELYQSLIKSNSNPGDELRICEKVLGTKAVWSLKNKFKDKEESVKKRFEAMMESDGNYGSEIILPGIIMSTNARTIEGNKVSWKLEKSGLFFAEMNAQSRMINTWAFIVTGIIVLIILTGFALPVIRKRKTLL